MNTTLEGSVLRTYAEPEKSSGLVRLSRFALLVVGGLVVFLPTVAFSPMLSRSTALVIRTGTSIVFLALALTLRQSTSLHKYWRLALSFFVASASLLFAWFLSGLPMDWLNLGLNSPSGIAVAKLSESFFVVVGIIVITLLYRGIFLRPFARAIGRPLTILATSLVFMLAHLEVTYTPDLLFFLPLVFVLGLVWGWLIQRTDSLIASILFHAGGDTLIVTAIFASYGASL